MDGPFQILTPLLPTAEPPGPGVFAIQSLWPPISMIILWKLRGYQILVCVCLWGGVSCHQIVPSFTPGHPCTLGQILWIWSFKGSDDVHLRGPGACQT